MSVNSKLTFSIANRSFSQRQSKLKTPHRREIQSKHRMYKMFRLHYAILLLLPLANANYKLLQQRRLDESYPPFQLTKGRCKKPIQTAVACANAVSKLAWQNTSALQIKELSWGPNGCFFLSTTNSLYFNTAAEAGSDDCSNLAKCGCEHCDDKCVKAGGEVSTCVDTPGWSASVTIYDMDGPTQRSRDESIDHKDKKTMTCEQMSAGASPNCKDGKVISEDPSIWKNEPEKNCCACGKGPDDWRYEWELFVVIGVVGINCLCISIILYICLTPDDGPDI